MSENIRPIESFDEIESCIELQRTTWGMADVDITPGRLFVIARYASAPPLGAFDATGRLVGFVHTLYGRFNGTTCFFSHMLAVEESQRNTGVGYRLKLAQREQALAEGVRLVVWTFDPLQSRNAYFNLMKLGAVARRYVDNYYGERHTPVFDSGLGSDRLFAEWWVGSRRVDEALRGESRALPTHGPRVEIPADIASVKREDQEQALIWRLKVREQFTSIFSRGLVAVGIQRVEGGDVSRYAFAESSEVDDAR